MRKMVRAVAFVLSSVVASSALAVPKPPHDATYKKGVKLENEGALVDALATFESLTGEARDFDVRLHIGGCKRKLNRLIDAAKEYRSIVDDPAVPPHVQETAASDLELVESKIPRLRLKLAPTTADVAVTVDGAAVSVPVEHRVDPGTHEVVARRGGAIVFERKIDLAESMAVEVVIDAPAPASAAAVSPSPPPSQAASASAPTDAPRASTMRGVPFLVGGVVLGGVTVGSFLFMKSAQRSVEQACSEQLHPACDTSAAGAGRVRAWEAVSFVSAGLAVASLGVGFYLVLSQPTSPRTAIIVPAVGPSVAGVSGLWRF